jgi:hypothetical protein
VQKMRLLKLAKFLREKVYDYQFDMSFWAERGEEGGSCMTAGCALGWATVCFPRSKLKVVFYDRDDTRGDVIYGDCVDMHAAIEFFGLTYDQARQIFSYAAYGNNNDYQPVITRQDVAHRIEQVVAKEQ